MITPLFPEPADGQLSFLQEVALHITTQLGSFIQLKCHHQIKVIDTLPAVGSTYFCDACRFNHEVSRGVDPRRTQLGSDV